jgi:hypothetical protein
MLDKLSFRIFTWGRIHQQPNIICITVYKQLIKMCLNLSHQQSELTLNHLKVITMDSLKYINNAFFFQLRKVSRLLRFF